MALVQIRLSPEIIEYVRDFGRKHGKLIDDAAFRLFKEQLEKLELKIETLNSKLKAKDEEIKKLKVEIELLELKLKNCEKEKEE